MALYTGFNCHNVNGEDNKNHIILDLDEKDDVNDNLYSGFSCHNVHEDGFKDDNQNNAIINLHKNDDNQKNAFLDLHKNYDKVYKVDSEQPSWRRVKRLR